MWWIILLISCYYSVWFANVLLRIYIYVHQWYLAYCSFAVVSMYGFTIQGCLPCRVSEGDRTILLSNFWEYLRMIGIRYGPRGPLNYINFVKNSLFIFCCSSPVISTLLSSKLLMHCSISLNFWFPLVFFISVILSAVIVFFYIFLIYCWHLHCVPLFFLPRSVSFFKDSSFELSIITYLYFIRLF